MRAILNVNVGRIWPAGHRFPTPTLDHDLSLEDSK